MRDLALFAAAALTACGGSSPPTNPIPEYTSAVCETIEGPCSAAVMALVACVAGVAPLDPAPSVAFGEPDDLRDPWLAATAAPSSRPIGCGVRPSRQSV